MLWQTTVLIDKFHMVSNVLSHQTQDGSEDSPGGKSPLTEKSPLDDAPEAPLDLEVSGKEEPDPSEDIAMSDDTLPEFGIVFFPIFVPWCAFFWISCKRWFSYYVMTDWQNHTEPAV